MGGISVKYGYLSNTIEAAADWTCECQTGCVGKSNRLLESQQTVQNAEMLTRLQPAIWST